MKYILSSRTGIVTARNLAEILNIKAKINPRENSPLIRWGNSSNIYKYDTLFNEPNLVQIASNKESFSNFAKEKNINAVVLERGIPKSYPIFVRTLLNSYSGKGIVIAENEEQYLPYKNYSYSIFKKFAFELRVHVLGGKVVKILKKEKNDGVDEVKLPIRNTMNGYHFALKDINNYPKVIPVMESLFINFPLQMMGVDIGYVNDEHKYYIIEVNTCPSLNVETIKIYADFLRESILNV